MKGSSSFVKFCKKLSRKRKITEKQEEGIEEIIQRRSGNNGNGDGRSHGDGKRELQAVFDHMDADRDGRISPEELRRSFESLGGKLSEEEAEVAVRLSDSDGDGMLDFEEFLNMMTMDDDEWSEEERRGEIEGAFRMYTCEGRECITAASLKKMLGKLGEFRTMDDCRAMIRVFDLNSDGVLSFDEFALMMR
ncbi:PREDICTED: calcium-binding protein CML38 [Tarenaya hassleriana]|uniref:calcium-binding protein CML38 n=1 Tax=Tarenaya hassleriana TaxID=28532 RepID=UPI00053C1C82|nr:PREDICTED: calcium-binding protein CML38 [Tarenaya hassleriana]